ncbi:hypothetical protein EUTSA_v10019807mg [Eutrema salsugineum]|uniref:Defensin-like protein 263 n=1 Tax=Eutrema salsugineum TaxID=72664 RepID=V4KM41_EUTSA|nr:putative defensin-like protein 262 [Eutrema salsugineum]ESQ28363.1 hypothetical protein EUTSA_v10019807mg [Eutrema salsugineum]
MEKTSLKLVFLFSLTVITFCSFLGDAREMAEEEVSCLGSECPEGNKNCNCLPRVAPIMESTGVCEHENDCKKYCPLECKSKNRTCVCACNGGHCFCQC